MTEPNDCKNCFYHKDIVSPKGEKEHYCFAFSHGVQPYFAVACNHYRITKPLKVFVSGHGKKD